MDTSTKVLIALVVVVVVDVSMCFSPTPNGMSMITRWAHRNIWMKTPWKKAEIRHNNSENDRKIEHYKTMIRPKQLEGKANGVIMVYGTEAHTAD
jgi:hypothetical protein